MADERTVDLRIDGSQGAQALGQVEAAAEGAADAMGELAAEVEKTETNTRRLTSTSRDYQAAARTVGDSVQSISRFEQAYRASLADTSNAAETRAKILAAAFSRTIGGAMDETRATALLAAGHRDAADAVRFVVEQQAVLAQAAEAVTRADAVATAAAKSNAAIRVEALRKEADARRQEAAAATLAFLGGGMPSGGKSAGESAGVFALAFREEAAAADASAAALIRRQRAEREDREMAERWQAMLAEEAQVKRKVINDTLDMGDAAVRVSGQMVQARQIIQANLINVANVGMASGWDPALMLSPVPDIIYGLKLYYEGSQKAAEAARETGEAASASAEDIAATGEIAETAGSRLGALGTAGTGAGGGLLAAAAAASAVVVAIGASVVAAMQYRDRLEDIDKALKLTGQGSGQTASSLESFAHTMADSGRVSVSEAREIQKAMLEAGTVSSGAFEKAETVIADWVALTKTAPAEAGKAIAESLGDQAKTAQMLMEKYQGLTAEQVRAIEAMVRMGDTTGAQNAVLDGYRAAIARAASETSLWTRAVNGLSDAWDSFRNASSGSLTVADKLAEARERLANLEKGSGTGGWMFGRQDMIDAERRRIADLERQLAEERDRADKAAASSKAAADLGAATTLAKTILPTEPARQALAGQRATVEQGLDAAKAAGDAAAVDRLTQALGAVNRAESTYVTEGQRAVLMAEAQAKATQMGGVEGQRYLAIRQAEIGLLGKAVEAGEAEATMQAARTAANAAATKAYSDQQKQIAAAAIDARKDLALTGLDAERQALTQRRALLEVSATEELSLALNIEDRRRAVEMEAAEAKLALLRKDHADQRVEIAAAEADITALRAKHAAERQKQLDEEVAARAKAARDLAAIEADGLAGQATAGLSSRQEDASFRKSMGLSDGSEQIASARAIAEEKYQIERDLLDRKLALAGQEETERARIANQLVDLEQRRALQMKQIDHQETLNRLAEIKSITAPFLDATQQMTQGYIQGTLTRQQLTQRAAQSIAISYANMGVKVAADWMHRNIVMGAADALFANTAIGRWLGLEAAKTGATGAGAASRTAIGATENASFFGRIAEQIAQWLGLEAAKTGATAAEAGARATTDTAASIAAIAAAKAEAAAEIPAYAGIGAAAAMASVAAIPFVGWAMAPEVGAAHLATAMSFLGVAAAERGWGEVPSDDMPTLLHKKEMVLPASLAVPLRAMLTGGGAEATALPAGNAQMRGMPRLGLPDFLRESPGANFTASSNTTHNSPKIDHTVNVGPITVNGPVRKQDIMNMKAEISEAVFKAQKDGNAFALALGGRKKS
ncbi:phage tail length tape measure family protein [Phaeospirillum tilakii]|uniref:Phage tail length tape measure family protein n=1 Tax=Phaeospirillum tilakii TaxID=741673 RepID=A0ABW5CFS6_9PROT